MALTPAMMSRIQTRETKSGDGGGGGGGGNRRNVECLLAVEV